MTDEEPRAHRWLRLLEDERAAFERTRAKAETAGPAQRERLAREWLAACSRLLMEHMRSRVVLHEGGPLEPYPGDAIGRAAKLIEALSVGRLPQPVVDATAAGGRPERWPGERRDVATAVFYIGFAKSGKIADRAYNRTVADAFNVDRTTVQGWWRQRDTICAGIPDLEPDEAKHELPIAGERYHYNRTGERADQDDDGGGGKNPGG